MIEGSDVTEDVPPPALLTRTSGEILARKGLPRALEGRSVIFVMGPSGVGKTTVARRLLAATQYLEIAVQSALIQRARRGAWPEPLINVPGLLCDGVYLKNRYGAIEQIASLLVQRAEAGRRTVLVEGASGELEVLYAYLPLRVRGTILLRFPVGRGRRNFVRNRAIALGKPWDLAREAAAIEPWTYRAVEERLAHIPG